MHRGLFERAEHSARPRPTKAELAALVVHGPSGWTPQAFLSGPGVNPRDCLTRPGWPTYSGWLASETRSWRQNPTPPAPGFAAVSSIYVCLGLFWSPSAAKNVLSQIRSSYEAARHEPQPSSPTNSETLAGIPGDFVTWRNDPPGQEDIWFAKGSVVD